MMVTCFDDLYDDCSKNNYAGNICGASYKIIAIDSNGDIFPCQSLVNKKYLITNILRDNWLNELKEKNLLLINRCAVVLLAT